jgi:hypothetical protein
MRVARIAVLTLAVVVMAVAGEPQQTTIHVRELPPEPFPTGTCKEDVSGYLGTTKAGEKQTHLTDKQLGEYVRMRLSQGYSISLYPQISGKIFAMARCETKP